MTISKAGLDRLAMQAKVLARVGLANDVKEAMAKLARAYVGQLEPEGAALVRDAFAMWE